MPPPPWIPPPPTATLDSSTLDSATLNSATDTAALDASATDTAAALDATTALDAAALRALVTLHALQRTERPRGDVCEAARRHAVSAGRLRVEHTGQWEECAHSEDEDEAQELTREGEHVLPVEQVPNPQPTHWVWARRIEEVWRVTAE
ncbi:hypothetical protein FTUN_8170 [Frigoriglobus tundricola]|uniref:Uncharacterized protein n=1 Tax=Frigoriglobus tundricola TaxID=2774151 RepID=A0A6M5Z2A7_9BACT|nr:hypothetical protein FTUN_8170 [Frigoriglobus tundricola]